MLWAKLRETVVNREFFVNALSMADRHVAQGERIIASQRMLIARLDAYGNDTTTAKAFLGTFLISQQLHEDDRRRFTSLLAEL